MPPVKKPARTRHRHFFKEWRESRNMTVAAAIDELGWSQSKISRLESGETPYGQDDLELAAEVYGCQPFELITRDPNDKSGRSYLHGLLARANESQLAYLRGVLETAVELAPAPALNDPNLDPDAIDIEGIVMPALTAIGLKGNAFNLALAGIETALEASRGTKSSPLAADDQPSISKPHRGSSPSRAKS